MPDSEDISLKDAALVRGLPAAVARLLAFLERRGDLQAAIDCTSAPCAISGGLTVGVFDEDWTEARCRALISSCSEGELGTPVPVGTSPLLVASAIKFYLSHLREPLLDIRTLESIGAMGGMKPKEMTPAAKKLLADNTDERSFLLLSAVVLALFRISAFSNTNLMTPEKIAGAMVEAVCHRQGSQCTVGLALLIENAPKFFEATKLSSCTADKERRRAAFLATLWLKDAVARIGENCVQWGFQRWLNSSSKGVCTTLLANTLREQGQGRLVLHKAVRHIRSTMLARGFSRWALLLDLKPKAIVQQCQSKVQIYQRWGRMKYDSVIRERRLLLKENADNKQEVIKVQEQLEQMRTQLDQLLKEKDALVRGNLAKIRRLAEIRNDPSTANDVFDDPALSVLDPDQIVQARDVGAATARGDGVLKEEYMEKVQEVEDLRKKLVQQKEMYMGKLNDLEPEAEEAPKLRVLVANFESLSQQMLFSMQWVSQSLAIKTIQGHLTAYYRRELGRTFLRWVHVINDKRCAQYDDMTKRADTRLAKLEDINALLEKQLQSRHQQEAHQRGQHMLSRWWSTSAEWVFGRWQKAVCLQRVTASLQNSIKPVVGRTILDGDELLRSAESLKAMALIGEDFAVDRTSKMKSNPQVISDIDVLLDSFQTIRRHAIKLDNHSRSVEAAELIGCIERSVTFHKQLSDDATQPEESKLQKLDEISADLDGNELISGLLTRGGAVNAIRKEVAGDWKLVSKTDQVRSFVKVQDSSSRYVCVKVEGLADMPVSSILVTALDAEQYIEWLPLLLDAGLASETNVFQRTINVEFVSPGPYANRSARVIVDVVDDLDRDAIVVCARSDPEDNGARTIEVRHFGIVLKPVTASQTLVQILLVADFRLPDNYVPPRVPEFIAETAVNTVFGALLQTSQETQQRNSLRSAKGSLVGLRDFVDSRVESYLQHKDHEGSALSSYSTIDDVTTGLSGKSFSTDMQRLSEDLLGDLQFMINDFQLSGLAASILQDAQNSGSLPFNTTTDRTVSHENNDAAQPASSQPRSAATITSGLAAMSKARQRSKLLTVAASHRRTKRGGNGTIRSRRPNLEGLLDQDQVVDTQDHGLVSSQEKHFMLFTSTYADSLDIKAKTDRIKMILDARGLEYDLIDLHMDPEIRQDMEQLSGDAQTLPQLFIDGNYLLDGLEELQYLHDNDLL